MYCHVSRVLWLIVNGLWIGWLDLLVLLLQSLITAHNLWLPKTSYIPSWTTVSHLPLWLTCANDVCLTNPWQMNYVSFYNLVQTRNRTLPWMVCLLYCAYLLSREHVFPGQRPVALETCLPKCCPAMDHSGFQAFWHTHCHANMHQLHSNCVLASHCPAVYVYSCYIIPAFSRHVTVCIY
jgi:hypothetical protein